MFCFLHRLFLLVKCAVWCAVQPFCACSSPLPLYFHVLSRRSVLSLKQMAITCVFPRLYFCSLIRNNICLDTRQTFQMSQAYWAALVINFVVFGKFIQVVKTYLNFVFNLGTMVIIGKKCKYYRVEQVKRTVWHLTNLQ